MTLDQNNFCGLGVTKTGMKGNSFSSPAEGIRAQIQHLQAYACTDRLEQKCIDPRYTYVNRGCAEYVEYLGIQENPKGQGWASGRNYGQKIINILKIETQFPVIQKGSKGIAVSMLQAMLGVKVDGDFGNDTDTSLKAFQKNVKLTADGICGADTWTKVIEHMKANTK